jgi:Cdc6-like AAA superfamily ATPase
MATKRILNFKGFVNESYNVSEGRLSDWFGKLKNLVTGLTGFAKDFFNAVLSGEIKTYKSGPKAGLPVDMLFSQEFGSVLDQMMKYENGQMPVLSTAGKMASEAPLTTPVESVVGEAKIPLGWPGLEGDVRDIGVEEFKDDIRRIYWSKTNLGSKGRAKPLFIFGAPGIGKTQIVGGVADELGCDVVKLDLQFYNPEDFLGIPLEEALECGEIEIQKWALT